MPKFNQFLNRELFFALALLLGNALIIYVVDGNSSTVCAVLYTVTVLMYFFLLERMVLPIFAIPMFLGQFLLYFKYIPRKNDGLYYETLLFSPDGYKFLLNDLLLSVSRALESLQLNELMRGFFLLFLYPFINKKVGYENYIYLSVNLLIISLISIVYTRLVMAILNNHPSEFIAPEKYKLITSLSLFLLIISPTMVLHANELLKDFSILLLIMLAAYLYIKRRLFLFTIVLLFAFLNRSYSPLIIGLYVIAARRPQRADYMYISVFFGVILMLIQGDIAAIGNMVLSIPYVYINPLPVKSGNWHFPLGVATFGGCIFMIGFFGALLMIFFRKYRSIGLDRLPLSIFLFGFLLIAVGYNNIVRFEEANYVFGVAGDNNMRKIIPILPLVILQFSITICAFFLPNRRWGCI